MDQTWHLWNFYIVIWQKGDIESKYLTHIVPGVKYLWVPQGFILGPILLKNSFVCDLLLFVPDIGIANYADDNTPHATNKHLEPVLKDFDQGSDILLKWFTDNLLKANPEKYHLSVNTNEKDLNAGGIEISNSKWEKLLGTKIGCKLRFDSHVKSLCKKISQKLKELSRVAYQLGFNQRKLLLWMLS